MKHFYSHAFFCLLLMLFVRTSVSAADNSVMLAENWDSSIDISGWWMSEKLDGVRGCWDGNRLLSRSGIEINAPGWFTAGLPPFALDGELWIGRGRFDELSGIIRRKQPDSDWKNISYCIFDVPVRDTPFEKRIGMIQDWLKTHPSNHVRVIEQIPCRGRNHLMETLKRVETGKGEGLMLRRPGSMYASGRSRDILKVKTFHDAEAVVLGHMPGKGKHKGRMGSLKVALPDGTVFYIGTGFTDKQRETPPPVGSVVTFKYKEFTASGIPRFASFLRMRETF